MTHASRQEKGPVCPLHPSSAAVGVYVGYFGQKCRCYAGIISSPKSMGTPRKPLTRSHPASPPATFLKPPRKDLCLFFEGSGGHRAIVSRFGHGLEGFRAPAESS